MFLTFFCLAAYLEDDFSKVSTTHTRGGSPPPWNFTLPTLGRTEGQLFLEWTDAVHLHGRQVPPPGPRPVGAGTNIQRDMGQKTSGAWIRHVGPRVFLGL